MAELSTLNIKFNELWDGEAFTHLLWTDIPKEAIAEVLKGFYAYKLWTYINDTNYENIKELEGILELHNLLATGNTNKI